MVLTSSTPNDHEHFPIKQENHINLIGGCEVFHLGVKNTIPSLEIVRLEDHN